MAQAELETRVESKPQKALRRIMTVDGNEAVASVAHRLNEVIAIYPITPSSAMGEHCDEWSSQGKKNIWGTVPQVTEMQSEAGAAAAVHGALQSGSLSTTFTASQGLLLMIPTMYKIAGELTSFCMHVTARTIATHALSIFGDHSDVMGCRQTGFAMLCSNSPQEAHDFALIATVASLKTRLPFIHFFDGFRTSHEVAKVEEMTNDDLKALMKDELVEAHRARALTPDRPVVRGTAQNPDVFFQAREANNTFYSKCPGLVQETMDELARVVGRSYQLVEYVGAPDAERVIVVMGSGAEITHETVEHLVGTGEKVGLIKVRLYRPFPIEEFVKALPATVKSIAVLDRTKEPGATGDPLYLDVLGAMRDGREAGFNRYATDPKVIGGRYGLSSKEFTPAMVKAVFDELSKPKAKNHFVVGIEDDVTHTSLAYDANWDIEPDYVTRSVFFGLGADGTVGANKNSIKIIGEETDNYAQGYFVYDSKKSGSITISHPRFGPKPIRSSYLIRRANFVACHQFNFLDRYDVLSYAAPGAVFLLNAPFGPNELWNELPREVQEQIIGKKLKVYVIDAYAVAKDTGMGVRINTIMQTCFFAISGVLPREDAIAQIKKAIKKSYSRKGEDVVKKNYEAVDHTLAHLFEVKIPGSVTSTRTRPPVVSDKAPDFVKNVTAKIIAQQGDSLPVSAFPADGTWPVSTTQWEKRNIALDIPVWNDKICIQCNKCATVCPHAAIRPKVYDGGLLKDAPPTFKSTDYKAAEFKGKKFTIQVAPEDCTGCTLCVAACPAKDKSNPRKKAINMAPQPPLREAEAANFEFFLNLPEAPRTKVTSDVKGAQLLQPLFEFSGACTGCGETPYIKLLTQLFGDRLIVGNATGCSSIYSGNLPTTPYRTNHEGRGPAWANSLFEDAAEFSFGYRLSIDKQTEFARELVKRLAGQVGETLVDEILSADQTGEAGLVAQRERVVTLRAKLATIAEPDAKRLDILADYLVRKSVWAIGGDGWAYDIGYGGLDHVLHSGRNINLLVLDTEVYSNTGGQASKATPLGATAKFATAGKSSPKKDLGLIAMASGRVYVARVAMGGNDLQVVRALQEADSYNGPSIVIAYSHCIAHGFDLSRGLQQQELAVQTGYWPLFRFDPRKVGTSHPPFKLDSLPPKVALEKYIYNETRYRMLEKLEPARAKALLADAQKEVLNRYAHYEKLSKLTMGFEVAALTPTSASASRD